MPNQPRPDNRAHTVRVPDPLWEKALARAAEPTEPRRVTVQLRGDETVSEAVRRFLERYVR